MKTKAQNHAGPEKSSRPGMLLVSFSVLAFTILSLADDARAGISLNAPSRGFNDFVNNTSCGTGQANDLLSNAELGEFSTNVLYYTICGDSWQELVARSDSWIGLSDQSLLVTANIDGEDSFAVGATGDAGVQHNISIGGTVTFSVDSAGSFTLKLNSARIFCDGGSYCEGTIQFELDDVTGIDAFLMAGTNYEVIVRGSPSGTNFVIAPQFFSGPLTSGHTYSVSYRIICNLFRFSLPSHTASAGLDGFEFQATTLVSSNQQPPLNFSVTNSNLSLSWPISPQGFRLQETTALGPGAPWNWTATPPVLVGDNLMVTVGMTNSAKFYRLKSN